jgi:hypothetical protein
MEDFMGLYVIRGLSFPEHHVFLAVSKVLVLAKGEYSTGHVRNGERATNAVDDLGSSVMQKLHSPVNESKLMHHVCAMDLDSPMIT